MNNDETQITERQVKAAQQTKDILRSYIVQLATWLQFDHYQQPGGYESLRDVTDSLCANITDLTYRTLSGTNVERTVALAVAGATFVWKHHGMATYYVSRDLAKALTMTDAPLTMRLNELQFPREAMMFLVPRGMFVSPLGNEITAVTVARVKAGTEYAIPKHAWPMPIAIHPPDPYSAIGIVGLLRDNTHNPISERAYWSVEHPILEQSTVADMINVTTMNDIGDFASEEYYDRITHFAINALLMLTEKPELVEPRRLLKTAKNRKGEKVQWWEPRWLGRKFRVKRESQGGTHASPRMHWRNGHWRDQVVGPRAEPSRKRIWIEPVLVNAGGGG